MLQRLLMGTCWLGLFVSPSLSQEWSQWRGDQRDGVARNCPPLIRQLPSEGMEPIWMTVDEIPAARSGGWSSPIVAGGRVYVFAHHRTKVADGGLPQPQYPYLPPEKRVGMSDEEFREYERKRRDEQEQRARNFRFDEYLYCLDAETGKAVWTNHRLSVYTRFSQSGSPAVVDDRIYVLGAGRTARCIDAASGQDVWQVRLPGTFRDEFLQSSFAVTDGVAVVLCGQLFGLHAKSGEIIWTTGEEGGSSLHTSPVVWNDGARNLVISNLDGEHTICVEPRSGREIWRVRSGAGHATPVLAGDRLLTYGNSRKKGLRCYQLTAGEAEPRRLWTFTGAADPGSSPVVVGDHVYVQGERRLACVDLQTGKAAWMTLLDLDRPRYTSLVATDDKVIYAFDGILGIAANPEAYDVWMNAKIDTRGLLAETETFRKRLKIGELERTAAGQQEAERLWRKAFNNAGPLTCSSPALAGGKLYIRLKSGVACYDLRQR